MDFQDVTHWQNNKLDRCLSPRMGWSDISVSLQGPVVNDLCIHFVQRWNFIFDEKYDVRKDERYSKLSLNPKSPAALCMSSGGPTAITPALSTGQNQAHALLSSGSFPTSNPAQYQYTPPPAGAPPARQDDSHFPPPPPGTPPPQGTFNAQYYAQDPPPLTSSQPQPPGYQSGNPSFPPPPSSHRSVDNELDESQARGIDPVVSHGHHGHKYYEQEAEQEARRLGHKMQGRYQEGKRFLQEQYHNYGESPSGFTGPSGGPSISCQIARSCSRWSHGVSTERSIQNAYISIIENSEHFVYIENQFFITATSTGQKPVENTIGNAIVERILRAARAGAKYKVIVVIPAIPAFAGDLKDDASLGTRAIMEFQYNSINRGGHSIMESIDKAGFNPTEYIRFYNLRNYDRIDVGGPMAEAERRSGISYKAARHEHDQAVELPADQPGAVPVELPAEFGFDNRPNYQAYQKAANQMIRNQGLYTGEWDSVSECYMLGGHDIRTVPWSNGNAPEIDAFVSEELYVHSKVLIADDRVVICGSANLNDRSQVGDHDSEIAVIVEDPTLLESSMNGRPHRASKFAGTLRRQLFRKHLGLLSTQNMTRPDGNFEPVGVPNVYDYGSPEDLAVRDPLADSFLALWNTRANTNTRIFSKIFHPVPDDSVRTWADYYTFYEHFFHDAGEDADGKDQHGRRPSRYMWGHVVREEFSPGDQGCREVKELLSRVKGTLVEMPLMFLIEEDIAKEGLTLNSFTEKVYT